MSPERAALHDPGALHGRRVHYACTWPEATAAAPRKRCCRGDRPRARARVRTQVTEGSGRLLVLAVGGRSEWGRTMAMVASEAQETPLQEALGLLAAAIGKVGLLVGGVCFAVLLIRRGPAVAPLPLAAPRNRALLCQASGSAWLTLRCGWSGAARKPDVEVWGHANGRADNKQPTPGVQVSSRRGRTRTSTAPPGRALLSYPLALAAACATVLRLGGLRRGPGRAQVVRAKPRLPGGADRVRAARILHLCGHHRGGGRARGPAPGGHHLAGVQARPARPHG